jgi:predicted nucleic acid-binding protein
VSRIFVDSSALLVHLDAADLRRPAVRDAFAVHRDDELVTHGYVIAETLAVARRRFGVDGAIALIDDILPLVEVIPVEPAVHDAALARYRASLPSGTSFVDQVSFGVIEREGIRTAFALDADFVAAGIQVLPKA